MPIHVVHVLILMHCLCMDVYFLQFVGNNDLLDKIDTAYFCLCLDDLVPKSEVEMARNFLHSDGTNR